MHFQLWKVETQSDQVSWTRTTFRYNQAQFTGAKASSLGHHMVYPRYLTSYELERTISRSNLTTALKQRKNLKGKQHCYTNACWNYLLLNIAVSWGCISRRGRGRGGKRVALMSNLCLMSHHWYDVEKRTVPGSINLNLSFPEAQQKGLCWKDERKIFYILFC